MDDSDEGEADPVPITPQADVHEASSLVLIKTTDSGTAKDFGSSAPLPTGPGSDAGVGIDLPGFVRRRSKTLKQTLKAGASTPPSDSEPVVSVVCRQDLVAAERAADAHWTSLYGQKPGTTVVEAAITWLSRDLWPNVEASEGEPFTWTGANSAVQRLCSEWGWNSPALVVDGGRRCRGGCVCYQHPGRANANNGSTLCKSLPSQQESHIV